jgi:hypothetical protein
MTTAAPLARYGAMWTARDASGSATARQLHHVPGHDRGVSEQWAATLLREPPVVDSAGDVLGADRYLDAMALGGRLEEFLHNIYTSDTRQLVYGSPFETEVVRACVEDGRLVFLDGPPAR